MEPEKIVGWADPTCEKEIDTISAVHDEKPISDLPSDGKPFAIKDSENDNWFEDEDSVSGDMTAGNETSIEILSHDPQQKNADEETTASDSSLVIHADAAPSVHQSAINSMILDLELRNECFGNRFIEIYCSDITEFDVHRIQFEIQHAERLEALDFYQFVQSAYKVKQQALANMVAGKEDTPNLDALSAYLESKYEESFE